jgi:hypothetical protein
MIEDLPDQASRGVHLICDKTNRKPGAVFQGLPSQNEQIDHTENQVKQ